MNRALVAAKKDNDFIYHERIPSPEDLPVIGRAPMAKPTSIPIDLEGWSDVFTKLIPLNVQQAATTYASRKDHLVHLEITRLREATNQLNRFVLQLEITRLREATNQLNRFVLHLEITRLREATNQLNRFVSHLEIIRLRGATNQLNMFVKFYTGIIHLTVSE